MRFRSTYDDSERYYSVGIDEETGQGVLEVVLTGVVWTSLFFRLSDNELNSFQQDRHSLDDLAERLAHDKGVHVYSDRLIT